MARAGGRSLAGYPLFIRESLVFPYVEGQRFVESLAAHGEDRLNTLFREPPTSSEAILHADRFLAGQACSITIRTPRWNGVRRRLAWTNVLGEFGVRTWLTLWNGFGKGAGPADGWGGDRYDYYEDDRGTPRGLVWVSAWDSAEDAREFADASAEALARRLGVLGRDERPPQTATISGTWFCGPARVGRVDRRGALVSLVIASSLGDGTELARLASSGMRNLAP
jgi:hypothetical protein